MELATGQRTREHLLAGYMCNHNHVLGFLIPASVQQHSATTAFIEAPFIQWSTHNPLVVECTTNGLLMYTAPLHATPCGPEREVDSLPPWLLSLLHPSSPHYNLIVQHANCEGNWGLGRELAQYYQFSLQITRVQEHLDRWETELETLMGGRDQSRFRLERAQAGEQLQALQTLADPAYGYMDKVSHIFPISHQTSYQPSTMTRRGGAHQG